MANKKVSRRALFTSIMSLILCCAMLMGTTFAWFTDSVSTVNTIQSGNLDIELKYKLHGKNEDWASVTSTTELFDKAALWEPGHTEVVYLQISNAGTLALNYQLGLNVVTENAGTNVAGEKFMLSDYIMFDVVQMPATSETFADRATALENVVSPLSINSTYEHPVYEDGELESGKTAPVMALIVYMPEDVGNEANFRGTAPSIQLGVNLSASQKTFEKDSFNNMYDEGAISNKPFNGVGIGEAPAEGFTQILVRNAATNATIAEATVFSESVADPDKDIEVTVKRTALDSTVEIDSDEGAMTFDVTVTNILENNPKAVKIQLRVGAGLTIRHLYHNNVEIPSTDWDYIDEYLYFESTSFSPFTVVFDAESVDDGQDPVDPDKVINTDGVVVEAEDEFANQILNWTSTPNKEQMLETAFVFTAPHDSESVKDSYYKDWICDYFVKMDCDIDAETIFLGGHYEDFGWIGFNNPEAVVANEEIPLLGSALNEGISNWTYEKIVGLVGTFTCGVARVDGTDLSDLADHTFTVMLRLMDPANHANKIDVVTVEYTFGTEFGNGAIDYIYHDFNK